MSARFNPSSEYKYFVYDPGDHEFTYFKSFDDLKVFAFELFHGIVDEYGGWDESIDDIVIGVATHKPAKLVTHKRPPNDELDEHGLDKDGNYWGPEMEELFEYRIQQILKK
ncbi:MAG: hypothetical protein GQ468_05285 [Candidatus Scalindua sp.]|nr:hypothetical protein [Candidatus Scalindua sp.]